MKKQILSEEFQRMQKLAGFQLNENEQMSEAKEDLFNKYKSKIETLRDEFIADLKSNLKDLKKLSKEDKTKLSQMIRNLTVAVDDALSENKKIKEASLNPKEQEIFDDIISTLNEGTFDSVLEKIKSYVKKGLMTTAILASLMASPNLSQAQKQDIRQIAKTEMSDQTSIANKDAIETLNQALKSTNPYVTKGSNLQFNPSPTWNYGATADKPNATVALSVTIDKGSGAIEIYISPVPGKSTKGYEAIVANAKTLGGKVSQENPKFFGENTKISISPNKTSEVISFVKSNMGNLTK